MRESVSDGHLSNYVPLGRFDRQILNFDLQQIQRKRADENLSDDLILSNEQLRIQADHSI